MNPLPTLDALADAPQLVVQAGGRSYAFSELPFSALARLQGKIKEYVPHPLDALKPHLEGLTPDERWKLLQEARAEGRSWPPRIGTAEGAAALLGETPGQVEAIREGLQVHHPGATLDDAARLYNALGAEAARRSRAKEPADRTVLRVFGVLFGTGDPDREADGPKAGAAPAAPSTSPTS